MIKYLTVSSHSKFRCLLCSMKIAKQKFTHLDRSWKVSLLESYFNRSIQSNVILCMHSNEIVCKYIIQQMPCSCHYDKINRKCASASATMPFVWTPGHTDNIVFASSFRHSRSNLWHVMFHWNVHFQHCKHHNTMEQWSWREHSTHTQHDGILWSTCNTTSQYDICIVTPIETCELNWANIRIGQANKTSQRVKWCKREYCVSKKEFASRGRLTVKHRTAAAATAITTTCR